MDEARAVLARLDRIEALERVGAPAEVLLEEVRGRLRDAEAWVRAEPSATDLAQSALERCREALRQPGRGTEASAGLW
jgi:hypothetical protein